MITKKEVQHIARLARIGMSPKEEEVIQKDLSSVLEYIKKLQEVDVVKTVPTNHPFKIENVVRKDEIGAKKHKLLAGFLKVKSILK